MKKFTWKKLNFSDDAVHDPSTSQRPCFTEINSCMKKKNKKNISGENVPRQISNVEGSRLIEADTYQCVLADVHLAGCTINYGFH